MVQNVSWEWLLEGFKYELEVTVKPKKLLTTPKNAYF